MAATADSVPTPNQPKPRVLVTDDSKLVRKTATKILADKFDLVLAEDGEQAWTILTSDKNIQVVFTDLGMPNLDGYGLIQRIRSADDETVRDLPVIVITGAAEEESVRKRVFEIGATDFVSKPFKSTEIIARAEAHATYRNDKASLKGNVDIDLLTGTLNQKGLLEKLEKDVSFINRHKQNLALIIFELDNFKFVAEKIKQQGAEKIIKHVAQLLGKAIRKEDSFGRYEFAKFVTILPMAKTEGVIQLSKRLCEHVKSFKLNVGGEKIALSMSVGIAAVTKGDEASSKALMQTAERALSNANAVGPGEVQILKLESKQASKKIKLDVSIDALLESIAQAKTEITQEELQAAIIKLAPLVKILSKEQKQRLLK
jgi:diguanylate cyclase (GGDEF)-like protein